MATKNKIVNKDYLERQFKLYNNTVVKPQMEDLSAKADAKVTAKEGYALSKNDFDDDAKAKLEGLENYDDTAINKSIDDNKTALETLNGSVTTTGSVAKAVDDRVLQVVAGEDLDYDTLGKVSTWISGHVTSASEMSTAISTNAADIKKLQEQQSAASYEMESTDLDFSGINNPDVTITGTDTAVTVGSTITLSASAGDKDIVWTSSDETKATVADGVVTGVGRGEVTITASAEGYNAATRDIDVNATLTISGDDSVAEEGTLALTTNVAEGVTVTWESSDESKAVVANGVVTGVAEGTVVITAKADHYVTATKNVTVTAKATE